MGNITKKKLLLFALIFIGLWNGNAQEPQSGLTNTPAPANSKEDSYINGLWMLNFGLHYSVMNMSNAYHTNTQKYSDKFSTIYPHFTSESFSKTKWGRGMVYMDFSGMTEFIMEAGYFIGTGKYLRHQGLQKFNTYFPNNTESNGGGVDTDIFDWRFAFGPILNKNKKSEFAIEPGLQFNYGGHSAILENASATALNTSEVKYLQYGAAINLVKPSDKYMLRMSLLYNVVKGHKKQSLPGHGITAEICLYALNHVSLNVFYRYIKTDDGVISLQGNQMTTEGGTFKTTGIRIGYNWQ